MYRRTASAGIPWHNEYVSYDYGDIQGAYEVHAFQLSPNNFGVLFSDITKRKKMEDDINKKVQELEEFYDLAVGRELRMIELKQEIQVLEQRLKQYEK